MARSKTVPAPAAPARITANALARLLSTVWQAVAPGIRVEGIRVRDYVRDHANDAENPDGSTPNVLYAAFSDEHRPKYENLKHVYDVPVQTAVIIRGVARDFAKYGADLPLDGALAPYTAVTPVKATRKAPARKAPATGARKRPQGGSTPVQTMTPAPVQTVAPATGESAE
jgi:hypothetical protein